MTNGLVDTLKSINNTVYHNNVVINSLTNSPNLLLTLSEIDRKLKKFKMD